MQYKLNFESEFSEFFKLYLNNLLPPFQIELKGELGAGKTAFVRNYCNFLGFKESVSSPSYVLQHEYKKDNLIIEHWDLYRLNEFPEELYELPNSQTIRFIEWAEKFSELRHDTNLIIEILLDNKDINARIINIFSVYS